MPYPFGTRNDVAPLDMPGACRPRLPSAAPIDHILELLDDLLYLPADGLCLNEVAVLLSDIRKARKALASAYAIVDKGRP